MASQYAVINTASPEWLIMHDAARPYAVVSLSASYGTIHKVFSRPSTMRGASISAGKCEARGLREVR